MTLALPAQSEHRLFRFDISWPILIAFAAVLCVLIAGDLVVRPKPAAASFPHLAK